MPNLNRVGKGRFGLLGKGGQGRKYSRKGEQDAVFHMIFLLGRGGDSPFYAIANAPSYANA
jgi:hypothetical protein